MRKIIFSTVLVCISFFSFAQSAEEENIKKTLQAEADAVYKGDFDAWSNFWQHNPNVTSSFTTSVGHFETKGWDSLAARMQRNFKNRKNPLKMKLDSFYIETSGNMARVEYKQIYPLPINDLFPFKQNSSYRVMVKENNQWKTVSNIVTVPESFVVNDLMIESTVNNAGYYLLAQNKVNGAIELFKLNVKMYPNSWNTYDSLGEAYALAGNKELAIENYEKSVQLNPKSESGPEALKKLRKK
jgi:tetratricopeptide (TPR) repeat protein